MPGKIRYKLVKFQKNVKMDLVARVLCSRACVQCSVFCVLEHMCIEGCLVAAFKKITIYMSILGGDVNLFFDFFPYNFFVPSFF